MTPDASPPASRPLHGHPDAPCAVVRRVSASIELDPSGEFVVRYRVEADPAALRIPEAPLDPERLWAHTCCELFVAPSGGDGYVEWNFSPTGQFAHFAFRSYRSRRPSATEVARVETTLEPDGFRLEARAPLPRDLDGGARLSLTTVIEDASGALSYWALRHPPGRPDFHHRDGFALRLTPPPSPAIVDAPLESP